jgi:HSP20 family protein
MACSRHEQALHGQHGVMTMVTAFPFTRDWVDLERFMDRVVQDTFGQNRQLWSRNGATPQPMPVDIYATDDEAVVLAALPGVRPQDLDLSIHQNTVTISGKIMSAVDSEEAKGATWLVRELWSGEFRRSFALPFAVNPDASEATFEQGILKIRLPKAEHAKPRKISISAQPQHQSLTETSASSDR